MDDKELAAGMQRKIAAENESVVAVIEKHCQAQSVDPLRVMAYMLQKLQHTHKIVTAFGQDLSVHDEIEAILNLRHPVRKPPVSLLATIELTAQMQAENDGKYARRYHDEPVSAVLQERIKVANVLRLILKDWMRAGQINGSTKPLGDIA